MISIIQIKMNVSSLCKEEKESLLDRCTSLLCFTPYNVELKRQVVQLREELTFARKHAFKTLYEAYIKDHKSELVDGNIIIYTDERNPPEVYRSMTHLSPHIEGRSGVYMFIYQTAKITVPTLYTKYSEDPLHIRYTKNMKLS